MPSFLDIVLIALATWRLSNILANEQGPWRIALRLRQRLGIGHDGDGIPMSWPEGFFGGLFLCLACLSVWIGGLLYLSWLWVPWIVYVFAISTLVVIVDRIIRWGANAKDSDGRH